jgi:hypothetical protein
MTLADRRASASRLDRLERLGDSVAWNAIAATGLVGLPIAGLGAWLVAALWVRGGDPAVAQALLLLSPLVLVAAFALGRRLYPPRGVVIPFTDRTLRKLMRGVTFVLLYPLITALLIFSAFEEVTVPGIVGVGGVVALAALAPRLVQGFVDGTLAVLLTAAILPFLATHPGESPQALLARGLHPATRAFDDPWMTWALVAVGLGFAAYGVASHALYAWDGRRRAAEQGRVA